MHTPAQERLLALKERLRESHHEKIRIIAVTKTHGPDAIDELLAIGHRDFGENRQNEARDKFPLVHVDDLTADRRPIYHHIGPLQSGSARQIPPLFDYVHGVSSLPPLEVLATHALRWFEHHGETREPIRYLIQIRLTDEAGKVGGMDPDQFQNLASRPENDALRFCGLMTMGPENQDPIETREVFHRLRELRDRFCPGMELSIGMSGDWEIAIEEGATMIRIGSLIFGERGAGPWHP